MDNTTARELKMVKSMGVITIVLVLFVFAFGAVFG